MSASVSLKGRCPHCGNFLPEQRDPDEALRHKAVEMRADLEAAGHAVMPGGRVNELAAAMVLASSPATLRNWRVKCAGPLYLKAGGRVLYDLTDLARFMRGKRHGK